MKPLSGSGVVFGPMEGPQMYAECPSFEHSTYHSMSRGPDPSAGSQVGGCLAPQQLLQCILSKSIINIGASKVIICLHINPK